MKQEQLVLLGDRILPASRACIPVSDRGFLYGDGVYETLRIYRGCPFLLDEHLARLKRSGEGIYLTMPWSNEELTRRIRLLLDESDIGEGRMRISVTRGAGDVRAMPGDFGEPTLLATLVPLRPLTDQRLSAGVRIETSDRVRNLPGALDPAVKSGNLLNNLLARFEMSDPRSFEVLLPNHRGEFSEGSLSNFFLVGPDGILRTPPAEAGILLGITRSLVLELAREAGLDPREEAISREALTSARELFITSSTLEILPVSHLDGEPLPAPLPGIVTSGLQAAYRRRVEAACP